MYKKLICLTLVLVMLGTASMALASSPSTGGGGMTYVTDPVTGVVTTAESATTSTDDKTPGADALIEEIAAFVASGKADYEFFGNAKGISALLPKGYDLKKLKLVELSAFVFLGQNNLDFTFATNFKPGDKVVVMLGICKVGTGRVIKWIPLKANVLGNGSLKVHFTKAAQDAAIGNNTVVAVLCGK